MATVSDPALAHTLSEFLSAGRQDSITEYPDMLYTELDSDYNIRFTVKNIMDDYIEELKDNALIVELSDDEYQTYIYNPKKLAYDVYGSTAFYMIIMALNSICNVREFTLQTLLLLRKSDLTDSLKSIMTNEKKDLQSYNSTH